MPDLCPWCGHPKCEGTTRSEPHHSLCCLDRHRAACWEPLTDEQAEQVRHAARAL